MTYDELKDQRHNETLDAMQAVLICQNKLNGLAYALHQRTDKDYYCQDWPTIELEDFKKLIDDVKARLTNVQEYLDREWFREIDESARAYRMSIEKEQSK